MKKLLATVGATVIASFCLSANSQAATLDFTNLGTAFPNGSFAGTTYNITTTGGSLSTVQNQDGNSCVGLDCTRDGIGVNNDIGNFVDDDDEISSRAEGSVVAQTLTITFGETVNITGISFLDFFRDDDLAPNAQDFALEQARVTYDGGSQVFSADVNQVRGDGSSGFKAETGLNLFTSFLTFSVENGDLQARGYGDFALASISGVSAVPLPPAVLMFGAALGGMGLLRRKKKAA